MLDRIHTRTFFVDFQLFHFLYQVLNRFYVPKNNTSKLPDQSENLNLTEPPNSKLNPSFSCQKKKKSFKYQPRYITNDPPTHTHTHLKKKIRGGTRYIEGGTLYIMYSNIY